ncbi:MAG: M20/M25/M40 family metallo-hydrolase [Actinomycetes bacterium]
MLSPRASVYDAGALPALTEEVELTQALIRNACVNDGGTNVSELPNADLMLAILDGTTADIEYFDAAPGRRSVIARLPGTDSTAPTLMLLGHTDVVPANPDAWQRDPFGGEVVDGFLWGRGSLDMLSYVATMSLAFRDYAAQGIHRGGDVVLALVADEEALGSQGMGWLQEHEPDAVTAQWVVTESGGIPSGAPADRRLGVLTAEKGAWRMAITVRSAGGHGSMPPISASALEKAAEVIVRLRKHQPQIVVTEEWHTYVHAAWDQSVHEALTNPSTVDLVVDLLPESAARTVSALTRMTIVPTTVETSGSLNVVADTARINLDVRTLPGQDRVDVLNEINAALGDLFEEVQVEVVVSGAATRTPPVGPWWNLLQTAARLQYPNARLTPAVSPGATDARFMRQRGAEAFGFGLMSEHFPAAEISTMLHGVNERIDLSSLAMMRTLWQDLLAMFAAETTR